MSYTYHGTNGIIVLPGRSISTFPSGLVRVDRTYAVRADRASVVRREFAAGNLLPFDDGTPAIDGLYIFPEPQETRRDDGFVEFKVSGYGRTSAIGRYTRLQGSEVSPQAEEGVRWGRFIVNEFLLQQVCIIRPSPIEKVQIERPAPAELTGRFFRRVDFPGQTLAERTRINEYAYWTVINASSIKFGIIEELSINWVLARTYGNEWQEPQLI
jgi:hypothetical protein